VEDVLSARWEGDGAAGQTVRLIVQIPCLNEEESLPTTLAALPRSIEGVDTVEVMVINDGSTDRTVEVARSLGVEHILSFKTNQGLAKAFTAGLREAARLGADYVVNLDADNQYDARDIPKLIEPLREGRADIVVGERPIEAIRHFSFVKKKLQQAGSWVVRRLSKSNVRDSPSGFRAFNRKAMLRLFIFNEYTYTHESLIAAGDSDLKVVGVPIRVNPEVLRPSRLMKSTGRYVWISGRTILRFYLLYNPRTIFNSIGVLAGLLGAFLMVRFLYFYVIGDGAGHVQSVIVGGVFLTASMLSFILAVFSDIMRINRKLMQETLSELREHLYQSSSKQDGSAARRNEKQTVPD
jgi:glycosyltransferase involved in cell wall biosynthesis